ncbi:DUF4331 family protein [Patiriisocius hiemis]|uniref:DUF4331 family protein n=1 Tax=Patiriisocius hiemis TaxID=3075604 RepID=A0ABU2YHS8_9FLAO|nr:DUF4331 family protein [Constantimarinum sp. W242]MDT0556810.1 DUF4331 family protein [Constantimarinum sp. W242]
MTTTKFSIIAFAFSMALLFVQCDDDENGNVIVQETCDDGIQNGEEEGIDCGGPACEPCTMMLDFSGTYVQEDHMGRPGINTVFSGSDPVKNDFNISLTSDRAAFQPTFEATLEAYHDVYGDALGVDLDYETNILGLDAPTFTTVLAQFDALQVAPDGTTTYFDGTSALTGRRLSDDVIDISLTLMFGGMSGTRFDGNNGTPQLTSDGVDAGDRDFSLGFPYLEAPNQE